MRLEGVYNNYYSYEICKNDIKSRKLERRRKFLCVTCGSILRMADICPRDMKTIEHVFPVHTNVVYDKNRQLSEREKDYSSI
jgi:hypothetical protein